MQTFLLSLMLLGTVCAAPAQGTLEFTARMTGDINGLGTFSLTGDQFTYYVNIPGDWGFNRAAVHGPAAPGTDAPIVFILGGVSCQVHGPGFPGACSFRGEQSLSEPQISDLISGLWYVRAYAEVAPEFSTRGQIVLVPEPSTWILLACGAAALRVARHRMRRNHATHSEPGA